MTDSFSHHILKLYGVFQFAWCCIDYKDQRYLTAAVLEYITDQASQVAYFSMESTLNASLFTVRRLFKSFKSAKGTDDPSYLVSSTLFWRIVLEKEGQISKKISKIQIKELPRLRPQIHLKHLLSLGKKEIDDFQKAFKCARGFYLLLLREMLNIFFKRESTDPISNTDDLWRKFYNLVEKLECKDLFESKIKNSDLLMFTPLLSVLTEIVISYMWPLSYVEVITVLKSLVKTEINEEKQTTMTVCQIGRQPPTQIIVHMR